MIQMYPPHRTRVSGRERLRNRWVKPGCSKVQVSKLGPLARSTNNERGEGTSLLPGGSGKATERGECSVFITRKLGRGYG